MRYKRKWYDNYNWLKMMLIDKSLRTSEIATYAGVSEETIRQLLIKHNLKGKK